MVIGYIVVECGQATRHVLEILPELYTTLDEAKDYVRAERDETASGGRGESYRIAEVNLLDEEGEA